MKRAQPVHGRSASAFASSRVGAGRRKRTGRVRWLRFVSLDEVPLRSVWRDEARDFTPWLAEHPDLLGRELRMDLELEGKEFAVGSFTADVVLRDANTGERVVVEN